MASDFPNPDSQPSHEQEQATIPTDPSVAPIIPPISQPKKRHPLRIAGSLLSTVKIDTSHLSFSIQNEALNSATVAIGGSLDAGSSATSVPVNYQVALQANGLWWCVNTIHGGLKL